jgi:ABC-type sugar transport system ATPase subunit
VLEDEGEEDAQLIASEGALLNARIDSRTRARVGEPLRLVVDPARFHFFDPETGASLLATERSMVLTS